MELIYAVQNNIGYGMVRNSAGNYMDASLETTTNAAAAAVAQLDENTDFRISITDAAGAQAYPIASFTWLLLPKQMGDPVKARALLEFVWWATHDGQRFCNALLRGAACACGPIRGAAPEEHHGGGPSGPSRHLPRALVH